MSVAQVINHSAVGSAGGGRPGGYPVYLTLAFNSFVSAWVTGRHRFSMSGRQGRSYAPLQRVAWLRLLVYIRWWVPTDLTSGGSSIKYHQNITLKFRFLLKGPSVLYIARLLGC